MVSDRIFSLPSGYSIQTATKEDLIEIVYFAAIGHSKIYKILTVIFLLMSIFSIISRSFATVFVLISCVAYLGFCFSWYLAWLDFLEKQMIVIYIVRYRNKICGYIRCDILHDYQFIFALLVSRKHQNRGIGSSLVGYCLNNTQQPVYLTAYGSRLKAFYSRFGFITIDRLNLHTNISLFSIHKSRDLMGFRNR
jgi:ribosomal protein S18 acetylase RimI-like enzyme